ncbi:ATP-binding protein [Lacinutrix neustonica]|uniref:ATP-binding protein n=1 Tax=Lacinutrix neustonica TaxID=2980107 RepID=A0A9E8MXQ0_9FLAO|nr:ATP-binding protein [Lacinutrix neustonica]WAC02190.1 ATP-binding protein [Lacinutrix neustonica]
MIHIIVGNTGSGKTTYSHRLREQTGGCIFSIDKWNKVLFLKDKTKNDGLEWMLERINRSETLMQHYILQLEHNGVDSILDLGFSKRTHRQKFVSFATLNKIEYKIHYLDISKELRKARVIQRNTEKGITYEFEVNPNDFDFMETWFETPTNEELKNGVHIKL